MGVRRRTPWDGPPRAFWQIWNMSFGFLGIQFGRGLQMAYMSAIYEYLRARTDELSILWLAAPLIGLIVQPIIGRPRDRPWGAAVPTFWPGETRC
jgi:maltose/moltooligosaccharide transporter